MTLKRIKILRTVHKNIPIKNMKSAMSSYLLVLISEVDFMDKKEIKQANEKRTIHIPVILSAMPYCDNPRPLIEIKTKNVKPSRFAEVFRICEDLLSIILLYHRLEFLLK